MVVNVTAVFSGAPVSGQAGQPALPSYIVSFLLPPGVDFSGVSVSLDNPKYQDLAGEHVVVPTPPIRRQDGTFEWPKGAIIVDGKDMAIYGQDAFYPNDFKGTVSKGPMRQYNLVHIRIFPYLYNPATKTLRKLTAGTLKVSVSGASAAAAHPREAWVEKMIKETIVNPEALSSYGAAPSATAIRARAPAAVGASPFSRQRPKPTVSKTMAFSAAAPLSSVSSLVSGYGYLIVSSDYIWNNSAGLNNYYWYLIGLGADVAYLDNSYINPNGNADADTIAENIRYWIGQWYDWCYNTEGVAPRFVLLVGNPDTLTGDVPMKVWQTSWQMRVPTDFYYADLSSTCDSDCSAWLAVGRIPVYVTATKNDIGNLDAYFSKMISYSTASGANVEWRRNVLLGAEPLGGGINDENYNRMEDIATPLLNIGWNATRCDNPYVQYSSPDYFLVPSLVNMNPLPEQVYTSPVKFAKSWMSETPGIVEWNTHGGSDGACGILSTNPNATEYAGFSLLNNSYPAMVVSASCHTSDPCNENNLGVRTLYANAITYIGATVDASGGDDAWRGFSYYTGVKDYCAAEAFDAYRSLDQDPPNCIWFSLYGCPEASLNLPDVDWAPAPQNLKAQTLSMSQIQLTWNASSNAFYYIIQRSTDFSTKRAGFADFNATYSTSYVDQSANSGFMYKYRVCYVNSSDYRSGYSPIDSATTLDPWGNSKVPTTAPSMYSWSSGSNSATLSWGSVSGALSYNVKRSTSYYGPFVTIFNTTNTSCLDSNLMNGATYYFVVSGVNSYGQGPNSSPVVSVTPSTNLPTPRLTSVWGGGNPWEVNCSYNLQSGVADELGFYFRVAPLLPDGTYGQFQNIINYPRRRSTSAGGNVPTNAPMAFRINAANETTEMPSSNYLTFTTPVNSKNQVTCLPAGLAARLYGPSQVYVSWGFAGSGTCDSTQVFFKMVGYDWQSTSVVYPGSSTYFTINSGAAYNVYIRTVNKSNVTDRPEAYACSNFLGLPCTITASAGANGSISPSGNVSVNYGASQTFDITPNSDYQVNDVLVDGTSQGATTSYTFYNIAVNHTISATFKAGPCLGAQGGGSGLRGTVFGLSTPTTPESEYCMATDGNINTYYYNLLQPNGCYTGLDLGTAKVIGKVRFYPIPKVAARMVGGKFQGSNTSSGSGYVDLYTISGTPTDNQWNEVTIANSTAYRWVRYLAPDGSSGAIAEMEFYSPQTQYTLTTSATNGYITLNPTGGVYTSGTVVTLTAVPLSGYTFSGWSGDLTGTTNPATLTMNSNKSVTASFTAVKYTLTTSAANGAITLNPAGGSYNAGTVVTLTATPNSGYTFSSWSGDLSGSTNPATITMNGNKSVTANFTTATAVYRINCGGSASSPFTADQYYSGGTARTVTNAINMSGVTNPAPQAVYQAERYGASTYTLPNLTVGSQYKVRLHFAELYQTASGKRVFNVAINGSTVLTNFDIYAAVGAQYKATVREFTTTANSSGQIVIKFTNVTDNATIEGIEIIPSTPNNPPTVATPAAANPNPVTGTTTALSVLGADDGGEPNLTYTWATRARLRRR